MGVNTEYRYHSIFILTEVNGELCSRNGQSCFNYGEGYLQDRVEFPPNISTGFRLLQNIFPRDLLPGTNDVVNAPYISPNCERNLGSGPAQGISGSGVGVRIR